MEIIQEIMPNGLPIIVVAEMREDGEVDKNSIRVHPVIECLFEGEQVVLEALPMDAGDLSPRLDKIASNIEDEYDDNPFDDHETSKKKHKR
jgi:hypothetical protein